MNSQPNFGRPITRFDIKKKWISFSGINNFNDWIQLLLVNWGLVGVVLLFPLMRFIDTAGGEWAPGMQFSERSIFEFLFYLFTIDFLFLILNSRENAKINKFIFVSILEIALVYYFLKIEGITDSAEVLKMQRTITETWLAKYHVLIIFLFILKLVKLLMLNEAYYFNSARNLRFLIESSVLSVISLGQFFSNSFQYTELIPLLDLIQHLLRVLLIFIFIRLFFNHVPRRLHVKI